MRDYPKYQCTWYAAHQWVSRFQSEALFFDVATPRHAKYWLDLAHDAGLTVSEVPVTGSVGVWRDGPYGHVAIVEATHGDGTVDVTEYNYSGPNTFGSRTRVRPALGYILPASTVEFSQAWEEMVQRGIYTEFTKHGEYVTTDRLAVFLSRFRKSLFP